MTDLADEPRAERRVIPDVRADVHEDVARTEELAERGGRVPLPNARDEQEPVQAREVDEHVEAVVDGSAEASFHAERQRNGDVSISRSAQPPRRQSAKRQEDADCEAGVAAEPRADPRQQALPRREQRARPRRVARGGHWRRRR